MLPGILPIQLALCLLGQALAAATFVCVLVLEVCCFAAIAVWTQTGDVDHAWIIGSYFHYSVPEGWTAPQAKDISPSGGLFGRGDPMYVAYAHKKA